MQTFRFNRGSRITLFLALALLPPLRPTTLRAADAPSALEIASGGWTDILPPADLQGWTRLAIPPHQPLGRDQWHLDAARKALITDGDGGHDMLRFDRELTNAIFHVECRFVPLTGTNVKYNSGIFIRNSADGVIWHQCQLTQNGGFIFGDTPTNGVITRIKSPLTDRRMKPAGEWNVVEFTARSRTLAVWLNGAEVSAVTDCEKPSGYLALETEGYAIEFRNLKLKELP